MSFDVGAESKPRKLFTGLHDLNVIACNPTVEEAAKVGITLKDEPSYTSVNEQTNAKRIRLDFWVKSASLDFPTKHTLFLEDSPQVSSTGKSRFINDYGQNTYAESEEAVLNLTTSDGRKWFKPDGLRICKIGECELIDFMRSWMSIGADGKSKIEDISKLIAGNLSEIKPLVTKYPDRKVQLLLIVREYEGNWYQGVYSRYFSRAGNKTTTYWKKHLDSLTTKPVYQDSLVFKEFDPLAIDTDTPKETEDNPWK